MHEPSFWWRGAGLAAALLTPVAACYGTVVEHAMARKGRRAPVPVICVGNFTLGGAGKTPTTVAIARMLQAEGMTVCALTRGYGGRTVGPHRVDAGADHARLVGDEALLLAEIAPTIVARDRAAGAALAAAQGADVIVMDDGLQNPSLVKNFTLAVVDGRRGIGNGRVFPAGPLRAPLEAQLAVTDALLLVGDGETPHPIASRASRLPVYRGRLVPDPSALRELEGRRVLAFAGIGDPGKFFATARAAGLAVVRCKAFPDHHRFTAEEAMDLLAQAEREQLTLLTTEKDHARMRGEPPLAELAARARPLPVTMEIVQKNDLRQRVLSVLDRV